MKRTDNTPAKLGVKDQKTAQERMLQEVNRRNKHQTRIKRSFDRALCTNRQSAIIKGKRLTESQTLNDLLHFHFIKNDFSLRDIIWRSL
jgi:hypothetical protein